MHIRRMMGIAALGAAATSLAFVPAAAAQARPETFAGSSDGEALRLSLFGQELTVGSTLAQVSSAPKAAATGFGVAVPFEAGTSTATVEGPSGQDGSAEQTCEGPIDQIPGLSIALACSSSLASVDQGTSSAASTGTVGTIVANPVQPLLETPLTEILGPAEEGLDQLLTGLEPVIQPIDEGSGLSLEDTLDEAVAALFDGADLVAITVGDTATTSTAAGSTVATECVANGARIDVLDAPPVGDVDAPPAISVIIGEASTRVTADRSGGEATPEVNPSLVTVRSALLPGGEVAVPVGQSIEIPLPEPFGTSIISVAAGSTGTDDDGNTFATASAVTLDLLNGEAMQGGIELDLAACNSVAGATPAQLAGAPAQPVLPTTGGDGPNTAALASVVGLAGLGLVLVRRSRA